MRLGQLALEALDSLTANKVRSGLTMLGIIIGVAAVIAMMGVGAGAQNAITEQIDKIGTNLLYVSSGGDADRPKPVTLSDAQAIANPVLAPTVRRVAPVVQGQVTVSVPGTSTNSSMTAVTPSWFDVQTADLSEGQRISQANNDNAAAVVLLGYDVATKLFNGTTGLVGQSVRINGQIFKIIGVLKQVGGNGFGNSDNRVIVPLTTAQLRLVPPSQPGEVDMILVQADNVNDVQATMTDVSQILRARHKNPQGKDDFDILSTQSIVDMAATITGTLTLFLGGIAGISLLVGGIGIMNIMLVTVTERTREIGLRKAIGARKSDIRVQFLVESSLLSLGGGAIGILVGWGIASLIGKLAAATGNSLNPTIELNAVLMATTFSAAVGLFFGIYPANRAANLEPVEALRTE